jgi:uncharacterized membrane protein HdeD (DUF308 family)
MVNLVFAVLLVILGLVVLSFDTASLTVTSVLIEFSFFVQGLGWLALGILVRTMRWLWLLSGGLGIAAAIVAWAYPDGTLRVLALLLGCFLIVAGVLDAIFALTHREREHWWLTLLGGAAMLVLGIWLIQESDRPVVLLLAIVGVYCLVRGLTELFRAFRHRQLSKELAT